MSDETVSPDSTLDDSLDIAIIGMAGRFPDAPDVQAFWRNLREGRCSIRFLSDQHLAEAGVAAKWRQDPRYVPASGMLDDIDLFAADFFGYSPSEAELLDPQHRVLLECAWEAVERAGYDPERYRGLIGVYAGAGMNTYLLASLNANPALIESMGGRRVTLASSNDFLATRVSYKLGLDGPSVTVQSACSTSLVSVVLACQGLHAFQCDMALAGGVAIDIMSRYGYMYQEDSALSPDGFCRAFDSKARGTVPGSGVGLVVLKRLHDAIRDRDHIHAIIKGSALNNDGENRAGFTAPSVDGQTVVINTALTNADVDSSTIGYVECHGTGTSLGDPIEMAALTAAFGGPRPSGRCFIGSVKTNIGHLDAAAGIASLIKTTLTVEHGVIPPSLHFESPNPAIDFDNSPFVVVTSPTAWPGRQGPRRAGVSSFGMGGTNAHVILEQAPRAVRSTPDTGPQMLVLSARSDQALETTCRNLRQYLLEHDPDSLADIAYTLQVGRKAWNYRRYVMCASAAEAIQTLAGDGTGMAVSPLTAHLTSRSVAFAFSDHGAAYPRMASELYAAEPAFRQAFDEADALWCRHLARPLLEVLDRPDHEALVEHAHLFAVEYALAALWQWRGLAVEAVTGDGVGEIVAACVAGVFAVEDAIELTALRASGSAQAEASSTVGRMSLREPRLPMTSGATGTWLTREEATSMGYWLARLNTPARIEDGLATLWSVPGMMILQLGPGRALASRALQCAAQANLPGAIAIPALPADLQTPECLWDLRTVGEVWVNGGRIDWNALHSETRRTRVELPTYPFERARFWLPSALSSSTQGTAEPAVKRHARPTLQNPFVAPSGELETAVADVWRDVLGLQEVGVHDNFFELGGSSLLGIEIFERLRERLDTSIPITVLYEGPTISTLASLIESSSQGPQEARQNGSTEV